MQFLDDAAHTVPLKLAALDPDVHVLVSVTGGLCLRDGVKQVELPIKVDPRWTDSIPIPLAIIRRARDPEKACLQVKLVKGSKHVQGKEASTSEFTVSPGTYLPYPSTILPSDPLTATWCCCWWWCAGPISKLDFSFNAGTLIENDQGDGLALTLQAVDEHGVAFEPTELPSGLHVSTAGVALHHDTTRGWRLSAAIEGLKTERSVQLATEGHGRVKVTVSAHFRCGLSRPRLTSTDDCHPVSSHSSHGTPGAVLPCPDMWRC